MVSGKEQNRRTTNRSTTQLSIARKYASEVEAVQFNPIDIRDFH